MALLNQAIPASHAKIHAKLVVLQQLAVVHVIPLNYTSIIGVLTLVLLAHIHNNKFAKIV